MKPSLKVNNCLVSYKGKQIPLVSGEFHYWRVLRENWPAVVKRIKEMGLEVVSSYVPWNYHELKPGVYDFTGRTSPQKDLAGFIDLLQAEGLYLIARPGPYIYAEWPCGGPPERAVKHDRLSPEFLAMAKDYIDSVCKVLVPCQITKGGCIIMCQADNEPYPPVESFGNKIGCFKDKGMFKDWLREKYRGDLALLNRKWRAFFSSFDDACFYFHEAYVNTDLPMAQRLLPDDRYHARYTDCFDFIGWYAAKIVATVGGWLKKAGIEVPIFANSWSPLYADFTKFCAVADLAGTDIYPASYMEGPVMVKDNWLYNMDILKMSEADVTGGNVWSAEFQSGLYPVRDVGYLPPRHFHFVPAALMARGLKGWNWYMLVSRDNWFNCPINEWGRPNEYFPFHKKAVAAARKIEPWNCRPLNDVSLLVYKPHRVIAPGNFEETVKVLETADISYSYYNPQSENPPDSPVLLYAGADWLDAVSAAKVGRFVTAGGTFITFNRYPVRDEFGDELKGLPFIAPEGARPANLPVTVSYRKGSCVIVNAGHCGCKVNFTYFRNVPGEPVSVTLSAQAKETLVDIGASDAVSFSIGYARKAGKGRVIYLGTNPASDILRMVLEQEGRGLYVSSGQAKVTTSVFSRADGARVLFAVNRNDDPRIVNTALNIKRLGIAAGDPCTVEDVHTGRRVKSRGRDLACLPVEIGGHDVAVKILY